MITITHELRPCVINGSRALFHSWAELEKPIMDNDKIVGSLKAVNAIVELSDGTVKCVSPSSIRFSDTAGIMAGYKWSDG